MSELNRVARARAQLVTSAPFFGALALHLDLRIGDEACKTFQTDGKFLAFNPAYSAGLNDRELRGIIAHEVMHCAYGHIARRGNRDHSVFNQAADYAINLDLIESGFTLPADARVDRAYAGMTAEAIYAELMRKPGKRPSGGGAGEFVDAPRGEEAAQDWQGKALMAAAIARKQGSGKLPASLERLVSTLRTPEINWRDVLKRFVSDSTSRDYTWSRPARRHIAAGLYLPSLQSDGRNHIVVAIDTSGSVDETALAAFHGEVQALLDDGIADRFTVIDCDRRINSIASYEAGETIKRNFTGGGGTSFAPVMDWLEREGVDASCLIYFTDLRCENFGAEPTMPVLWANWLRPRAVPFGEVLQIDGHAR